MRRKKEESSHQQLAAAKRSYKAAVSEGNRQEEARWANVTGNILKNRGEYVEALRWLRKDYDVSVNYLPEKQLLATCQSLGEIYLRLQNYELALTFQKKHLEMANDTNDLVEQQRANTQLGRTYHEMFMKSDDDHDAVRSAKYYFDSAKRLAETVKGNPLSERGSFIKEFIDAYNNIGMLQIDLDNLTEAESILTQGLKICNEEEVNEDDDTRSRLHHNLGNVYLELRRWEKALEHIKKDISICNRIGHCQGEAKGFINLGELYYRNQKYDQAMASYQKAFELANSLEDEDALANQISQNIATVEEAMKVMDDLKKEEQNLKRLERNTEMVRGQETERKCLLKQNESLDLLIDKSRMIIAWIKLREYGKRKKKVASELCDMEKLSDSFMVVGESYQQLRKFSDAFKWYQKGLTTYIEIGNLEGQALAKINIGDVLDSNGNWAGALVAFEEGYKIAVQANLPSLQLSALENMHYSHMIRFNDAEKAKTTKLLIKQLKESKIEKVDAEDQLGDCCSETKTELDNESTDNMSDVNSSQNTNGVNSLRPKSSDTIDDWNEKQPLSSLRLKKRRTAHGVAHCSSSKPCLSPDQTISRSTGSLTGNHKRIRIILSDDEGDHQDVDCSGRMFHNYPAEGTGTSDELGRKYRGRPICELQDVSPDASRCASGACTPSALDNSICSCKSRNSKLEVKDVQGLTSTGKHAAVHNVSTHGNVNSTCFGPDNSFYKENTSHDVHSSCEEPCQHIIFEIDGGRLHVDLDLFSGCDRLQIEQMKVKLASLYYLRLSKDKRSRGRVPVIEHLIYNGRVMHSTEALLRDYPTKKGIIEVSIDAVMVPKNMMKLYIDCCEELAEPPVLKVVEKLYQLEVSEDKIVVSNCDLRDVSAAPLLNALQLHNRLDVLDLSHNLLGTGTVEKLKQVFISSRQISGARVLNLHDNQLSATALNEICMCPVLYARLEVLNISGNSLGDGCASYLSTILQTCKALCNLNIENCSITSKTVQKVADSLYSESVLTHLSIGYNYCVSWRAISNLLLKLASLNGFQELNLNGIELSEPMVDSICQFANDCCLTGLMLGNTGIGNEGAMQLMKPLSREVPELVRLDLSFCGLTRDYISSFSNEVSLVSSILELNLGGNPLMEEGSIALASLLSNPRCRLRVLVLSKCNLALVGMLHILESLSANRYLEKLNLAENVESSEIEALTDSIEPVVEISNTNENQLEVADSEDEGAKLSGLEDGHICLSPKKICLSECMLMKELKASIKKAGKLNLLDLSDNGFLEEVATELYLGWSSGSRVRLAERHIEEKIIHFSVQGTKCCGIKSCCRGE